MRRTDDERGVVLILVALSVTMLMIWAALVIDGSQGYNTRRRMQNAADASAMAGAQALRKYQLGTGPASDVNALAYARATGNGADADTTQFICKVVQSDGVTPNLDGSCTNSATLSNANSAGISVTVENDRNLFFGPFVGQQSQAVRARAAASVQPLLSAPVFFWVCGNGVHDTNLGGYDLLDAPTIPGALPTLNVARATSLYGYYQSPQPAATPIQSNSVPKCGSSSSSADGKDGGQTTSIGSYTAVSPGNGSNNQGAYQQVVSATPCPTNTTTYTNCDIVIAVIDSAQGTGSGATVRVVAWTAWHVQSLSTGPVSYQGWFDGPATMTAGLTGTGACTGGNTTCVIKLIS